MRKVHPKTSPQHTHLLHDNFPAHKSSTVAQFLTSEKVSVLPHPPNSPDLSPYVFFLFLKLKKKNTYLVGDIGPEVHWGPQFTSLLWVYPKMCLFQKLD